MNISPTKVIEMFQEQPEWVDFEPESIWADIDDKLKSMPNKATELTRVNKDMILAIKLCFGGDVPWEDWDVFENVVKAINGEIVLTDVVQEMYTEEVAFAVTCMNKIRKDLFSEEVRSYIAISAMNDGLILMPTVLFFAQEALNGMSKTSNDDVMKVISEWKSLGVSGKAVVVDDTDTVSDIQCQKLINIDEYVKRKLGIEGRNGN